MKEQKTYKAYLNFFTEDERRITQEENRQVLKTIKDDFFGCNENIDERPNYPLFYNDRFYLGSPVSLTNVTKREIQEVCRLYKRGGYPKYWLTYRYRTLSLQEVRTENTNIKTLATLHNNSVCLNDNAKIFQSTISEIKQYRNGKAIMRITI